MRTVGGRLLRQLAQGRVQCNANVIDVNVSAVLEQTRDLEQGLGRLFFAQVPHHDGAQTTIGLDQHAPALRWTGR